MNKIEKTKLAGTVKNIIYRNAQNFYTVFALNTNESETVICTTYISDINAGDNVEIFGDFVMHPSYGKQFKVSEYQKILPVNTEEIEKYLSSSGIKGIGPKLAKKIVERFGKETFDVIENDCELLTNIRGISKRLAFQIKEIFCEQNRSRRIMMYLQKFGITPSYVAKIQKKYQGDTLDIIKNNPYKLADDIWGIGFKRADEIAQKVGIKLDSPYRIRAAIKYCLSKAVETEGHAFLPKTKLFERLKEIIEVSDELIEQSLQSLHMERIIVMEQNNEDCYVYPVYIYNLEKFVAKRLIELSQVKTDFYKINIDKKIADYTRKNNIILAPNQIIAVKESITNGVTIITGGPGTGKTTTLNVIIGILKSMGFYIELAAPTGRAAKRMTEATKCEARTLHRLLGINFVSENSHEFEKNEENPIEADYIIIDEASMLDIHMMGNLIKAVALGTKLILVGDVDQLPSVGPGKVLKDIISSECVKVITLNEIFRQAQESAIVINAHKINNGKCPDLSANNNDFFFMPCISQMDVVELVKQLVSYRLPKFLKCNSVGDIQVLTPMKRSDIGTLNLNKILQQQLNPPSSHKKEVKAGIYTFREGDKVMQIKNNYDIKWRYLQNNLCIENGVGVFNGDDGIIENISFPDETVTVKFSDNKLVNYNFDQLDELELSYAVTIHKSQGSEYKAVVIPVFSGPPMLMTRNLLYTAVTRAKELVVLVGSRNTIYHMIMNDNKLFRFTSLCDRIVALKKILTGD